MARKKRIVGRAFQPDSEPCQAGKRELLTCRGNSQSSRVQLGRIIMAADDATFRRWLEKRAKPVQMRLSFELPIADRLIPLRSEIKRHDCHRNADLVAS